MQPEVRRSARRGPRFPSQEGHIGTHEDEPTPELEETSGVRFDEGVDPGGLPHRRDGGDGLLDLGQHVGMLRMAQVSVGGGQVGRTDDDAVDTVDRGDGLELSHPLLGLDLHQDTNPLVSPLEVPGVPVPPRGSGQRRPDAPNPSWRIPGSGNDLTGGVRRIDHGNEETAHPDVEQLLDHHDQPPAAGQPGAPGRPQPPAAGTTMTGGRWASARCR